MSAQEAYEHIQPPGNESISPETLGAKIIPFPVRAGVGGLAVGNEIAVHQGSGTNRYLTRRMQTLSAPPNSHVYSERVKELGNKGYLL